MKSLIEQLTPRDNSHGELIELSTSTTVIGGKGRVFPLATIWLDGIDGNSLSSSKYFGENYTQFMDFSKSISLHAMNTGDKVYILFSE